MAPLDPKEAHHELKAILSRKAFQIYHHHGQNILTVLWNRFKKWLLHWLEQWFPSLEINHSSPHWVFYAVIILILFFIIFLVFQLWRHFASVRHFRNRRFGSESELALTASNHLRQADACAADGNFPLAVRHTFLALILHLDQSGLMEARPWKTNFEYYAELEAENRELAELFIEQASYFEEIVYGNHPVQMEDYQSYYRRVEHWINSEMDHADEQGGGE